MTEITKLENEIDSTNQILERTELALDSKSSELNICMAQVEVLESTNQTLSQNVQDQDSKIKNLKNDLESEKNLTKQKKSEILEMTSQTKKMKCDFEEKVTRLQNENEFKSGEIKKLELERLTDKDNIQNIQSENNKLKNQLDEQNKRINTIKVRF